MRIRVKGEVFIWCDALVDQGHFMGNDPVGYKCSFKAAHKHKGYDLCDWCFNNLARITLPDIKKD